MNKITEAMVAARDFMANRLEEARAAASHSEASLNDCSAAIAKLDEAIEAGELFIVRMTSLVLSGSDNTIWGRAIQYEGLPIKEVIQYANEGDPLARGYVCAQAGLALSSGKPLPRALRLYAAMVLLEEAENSRGRGRPTEWGRNAAIVFLLDMLKTFDIPPTRSDGTDPDEQRGSRIVAEWLNEVGIEIGEPGVAKVWEKYHEQILALKARHKN